MEDRAMGFGQAISSAFVNYFNFNGRATRPEYWYFVLFSVILAIVAYLIDTFVLGFSADSFAGPAYIVYTLGIIIPSLSVSVRRLHDIGRSGWWVLLSFIPIVGWIILIVWACQRGDDGSNGYGAPAVAY
jgi:uncharacterized membrane protein YhaH (DUF805 family)